MGNLEIFTTSERHDLDEQAKAAFLPTWPQFIFHDPVDAQYLDRAESYFPHYDVLLLEDRMKSPPGAGGADSLGRDTRRDCPDGGYDGALISAITGHENSVPVDTLCIMAAAVKAARQGTGLAGNVLTALRDRAHRGRPAARHRPSQARAQEPVSADTDGELRPLDPR